MLGEVVGGTIEIVVVGGLGSGSEEGGTGLRIGEKGRNVVVAAGSAVVEGRGDEVGAIIELAAHAASPLTELNSLF